MKDKPQKKNESYAYYMGFDAGMNEANLSNSSFAIFSTPENTKEWERGKKAGDKARQS